MYLILISCYLFTGLIFGEGLLVYNKSIKREVNKKEYLIAVFISPIWVCWKIIHKAYELLRRLCGF